MSDDSHPGTEPSARFDDLERRVAKLEESDSPAWYVSSLRWVVYTVLPAVIISVTSVLVQSEFTSTVDLKATVAKEEIGERNLMRYRIAIKNVGKKAAEEGKGYATVFFEGQIKHLLGRDAFPSGVEVVDDKGNRLDTCDNQTSCRITFGDLEPDGTLNIRFVTVGQLAIMPEIQYGGKPTKEWSCRGLRQLLQDLCE